MTNGTVLFILFLDGLMLRCNNTITLRIPFLYFLCGFLRIFYFKIMSSANEEVYFFFYGLDVFRFIFLHNVPE